ncbi:SNF2 family N-terminal domain-containing protein [Massariosphaeria phaeospora]|uniref:SNF2 family N-terminal domain-containing protein n=1 Tax=Massariosphaeria phaeospora TaxID=100035 RepID=A0A7C8M7T4_9PLEO|nr:SNF2 family N-terminal domain-containing protein [Massariosphaeria phaeospora]
MGDRQRPGAALPTTPLKSKGGAYADLLRQFGSQSSATSATHARKSTSFTPAEHEAEPEVATEPLRSQRSLRRQTQPVTYNDGSPAPSANDSTPPSEYRSPAKDVFEDDVLGEIDVARPVMAPSRRKTQAAITTYGASTRSHNKTNDVLILEKRKKERSNPPRRSSRKHRDSILESDTVEAEPPRSARKPPTTRPKPDTARTRLRGDIAQKTRAKANNFLVANKDYFLPLLPPNNYISKIASRRDAGPIIEYEQLAEQPSGVTATMKPYQLSGLSYLVYLHNNGFSGILGDEMGLGKTLQTLSLFQYLEEQDEMAGTASEELRPYLVVCPLSVLNSWVTEAQRWTPGLKVLRFHGGVNERAHLKRVALGTEDAYGNETRQSRDRKASRKAGVKVATAKAQRADSYKIIVTTYETFQADSSWFKHAFVWRYVVLDEGHKIKNNVTQISTALRGISAEYRLILTGTPLQNNLAEMWALLAWLYPDVFVDNSEKLFKESFDLNRGKVNRQTMDDARHLLELVMLRRMKDSPGVNLGLPPKEEVLLYVPLTPMQRFWYTRLLTRVDNALLDDLFVDGKTKEKDALQKDKLEDQVLAKVEGVGIEDAWEETTEIMRQAVVKEQGETENKGAWQRLMNLVMQLRKCCSHPYLLPGAIPDPYYLGDHVIRASGKFILLEKLLKHSILEQGKKVLIFSGFTHTLDCCEDLLALIGDHGQSFKYLRLDGSTARARRNLGIRMFNDQKSDYKVMLLSTRAGGLGINLTSAEDVIFLDEDWNPQITLQAEARAHRIGQTKKVTIYKLCTQGTVEEQMMGRIRKKLYLSAKITESMRNIHSDIAPARGRGRGRPSVADDMPQMDTSQLKTLVRRGAQTLSHPEIDVTEMLSWDLETMMEKCRDRPADPHVNTEASSSDIDEEKWLSVMERVECAVFDGKRYQRQLQAKSGAANILPDSVSREDRRIGKNTTVMIDGFAINKESLNCADWEAVPTFAGKDPRLAEPKREKRRPIQHEDHCLVCFDGGDVGHMVECKSCPRTYHFDCLDVELQVKVKGFAGFYCPQHECADCGKKTTDAGGLIYRCRWCDDGFCEDCLEWGKEELVGDNLPEFEMLGEGPPAGGFYIKCPGCVEQNHEDSDRKEWMEGMELTYQEQHEVFLKEQEEQQRHIEQEQDAIRELKEANDQGPQINGNTDTNINRDGGATSDHQDDDVTSPPALTNTSVATPAVESGISTPKLVAPTGTLKVRNKKRAEPCDPDDAFGLTREGKKAKLDERPWNVFEDPLLKAALDAKSRGF